ncbi:MAG: STAS domain-containing protein [Nevskia sp.]|nr:STAS domain-containing protein [Nevskia sp.]
MQETDSGVGTTSDRSEPARVRRPKIVHLPAELGIDGVAALKAQLAKVVGEPRKVVMEASEVERVHTAALQLFCLFCRDRRAADREVEFARPSPALRSAAALLGASTLLQISRSVQ